MSAFVIEIEDGAGGKYGPGELYKSSAWESVLKRDRSGTFTFTIPASWERASIVQPRRIARCYAYVDGSFREIGAGIIDEIRTIVKGTEKIIEASGADLLHALTYRTVGSLTIGSGGDPPTAVDTGPSDIMGQAQSGWSLDTVNGYDTTIKAVYMPFSGETVLEALEKLAELTGEHFRMGQTTGGDFKVIWLRADRADSGVRAEQSFDPGATNSAVCIIDSIEKVRDSFDGYVGRVYALGAGEGDARYDLNGATLPAAYTAAGYALGNNAIGYYLQHTDTWTSYGVEKYVQWKGITDQSMLVEMAYEYLRRRLSDEVFYELEVGKLDKLVYPGQTIRVIYSGWTGTYQWLDIDEDLVVLESTISVDAAGVRTSKLTVCTTSADRYPESDAEAVYNDIRNARESYTYPQPVPVTVIDNGFLGLEDDAGTDADWDASGIIAINGGDGIATTAGTNAISIAVDQGDGLQILTGQVAVKVSDFAGAGLSVSDADLAIAAADTSMTINADSIQVRLASPSGLDVSSGLMIADTVAGAGLTIASKVLAVGASDTSMAINPDGVQVNLASPSGLDVSSGLMIADTIAGAGLTIASKVLAITAADTSMTINPDSIQVNLATNSGLEVNTGLKLGSPTTLSTATDNTVTSATHAHAVTAYSDATVAGQKGHLLKSSVDGDLDVMVLTADTKLTTLLIDSPAGTDLTIQPAQDINLSPVSNMVKATSGVAIQSDNYASQTTGWRASYIGEFDARYVFADQMHVKAFIADLEQAIAGGQIIAKSVAVLYADFTIPAAGGATTLTVEDLPGASGVAVFEANDIVGLRQYSRAAGTLTVAWCYGVVTGYSDNADGTQDWTFTRSSGGNEGGATATETIERGTLVLDFGVSGNGYYEVSAIDGLWGLNSPYAQVVNWTTHPNSGKAIRSRLGNLRGIFSVDDEYGLYAGEGVTDSDQYIRVSDEAIEGHNLPINLYDGSNVTVSLTPGTNPYLAIGEPIPTGYLSESGIWAGRHTDGSYRAYIGEVSGGALTTGLEWDGSDLKVRASLMIGPGVGFRVDDALLYLPFDGPRPFETDYQVNTVGHLGQVATIGGGVIGRPGVYQKGAQIAEATTNLVNNPIFHVDESSWTEIQGGTGGNSYRDTSTAYMGAASVRIRAGTGYVQRRSNDIALANGETLTVQTRAWSRSDASKTDLAIYDVTNLTERVAVHGTTTGEWEFITTSWTNNTGSSATVRVLLRNSHNDSATIIWFDAVQAEKKAYPTPLCHGGMGDGHSWSGTEHNSSSARLAAELQYDSYASDLVKARGTVGGWYIAGSPGINRILFDAIAGSDSNNRIYVSFSSDERFDVWINGANRITNVGSGTALAWDGVYFWVLTWDFEADSYNLYVYEPDGTLYTGSASDSLSLPAGLDKLNFGSNNAAGSQCNGVIDDYFILDWIPTSSQIQTIYESGAPLIVGSSPFDLMLTGPGGGKVVGNAGGIFGQAADGTNSFSLLNEDYTGSIGGFSNPGQGDTILGHNKTGSAALYWDKSAGTVGAYGDGGATPTVYFDTDGKLAAGGGAAWMNADGVYGANGAVGMESGGFFVDMPTGQSEERAYKFRDGNGYRVGGVFAYGDASSWSMMVEVDARTRSRHAVAAYDVWADAGKNASIEIRAKSGNKDASFGVQAYDDGAGGGFAVGAFDGEYFYMAGGVIDMREISWTPDTPTANIRGRVYMKADKIVFQWNDNGTVRYKYLDLTGTGTTWVHTTTAP